MEIVWYKMFYIIRYDYFESVILILT
jgi:hypothetical protein